MMRWTEFLDPDAPDGAYLPWKRVEARVGISRTTAWRLQKAGDFPKPYVVSPGRVAYKENEVEAWKASRGHRGAGAAVVGRMARAEAAEPPALQTPAGAVDGFQLHPPSPPAQPRSAHRPSGRSGRTTRAPRLRPRGAQITFDF